MPNHKEAVRLMKQRQFVARVYDMEWYPKIGRCVISLHVYNRTTLQQINEAARQISAQTGVELIVTQYIEVSQEWWM